MEDAIPSTARHGTARGLPLKEVLEYVIPELNIQCLRLALNSPKVPEQLLKLDEQGVSKPKERPFYHIIFCTCAQLTWIKIMPQKTNSITQAKEDFLVDTQTTINC